jgi:hypothetical protein
MDLSENGKCLFTSLQYVESSHAPNQRIRFFLALKQESYRHVGKTIAKDHTKLSSEEISSLHSNFVLRQNGRNSLKNGRIRAV